MRNDSVGIAKQSAWGTMQTVPEYWMPVVSFDADLDRETISLEETVGHPFPTKMDMGTFFFNVPLEGAVRMNSFPRLASAFFGAPTTTTPEGSARSHVFDPAAAGKVPLPHSFLLNRTDPSTAITDLVWDAIGNELELSVEPNGYVMFNAGLIGRDNNDAQPEPSVTTDYSKRFRFHEAKAFISVDGGGESEVKVAGWGMNYSNNLDTDQPVLGQRQLFSLDPGNRDAEFRFSPREALSTHYRRALQADPALVKLRLTATGALITGATFLKLEVIAHGLEYISAPAPGSAADRLNMIEVTARAAYNESTSKFVTVEIVNTINSY